MTFLSEAVGFQTDFLHSQEAYDCGGDSMNPLSSLLFPVLNRCYEIFSEGRYHHCGYIGSQKYPFSPSREQVFVDVALALIPERVKINWSLKKLWYVRHDYYEFRHQYDIANKIVNQEKVIQKAKMKWDILDVSAEVTYCFFTDQDVSSASSIAETLPEEKRCRFMESLFVVSSNRGIFMTSEEDLMVKFTFLEKALLFAVTQGEVQRLYSAAKRWLRWEKLTSTSQLRQKQFLQRCEEKITAFGLKLQEDEKYPYFKARMGGI